MKYFCFGFRSRLGLAIAFFLVGFQSMVAGAQHPRIDNVLFLISDDLKASVLGCYGNPVCDTPNIDRLAREGIVLEHAYCQGTWCQPSRTSFMRSRYVDREGKTIGEHFRAHEIVSARVGKIFHMRVPGDIIAGTDGADVPACWSESYNASGQEAHTPGDYACLNLNIFTDALEGRQSTRMPHRMFVTVKYPGDGSDQPDWKAAEKSVKLLRKYKASGKRFFLATGFVRPHYPSVAPLQYFDTYPHQQVKLPHVPDGDHEDIPKLGIGNSTSKRHGIDKFPENQQRMWAAYYATVTFMDQQLGRVIDELERLGLRETTVIVFTSDHGYHLGEHHLWQKSNLHEEVTRVPLIISVPGNTPGRSSSIVELVDIYPTLCELMGVPIPGTVQGASLVEIFDKPSTKIKTHALSINRGSHALRSRDWAYMRYKDGTEELYDMRTDAGQFTNLAVQAEGKPMQHLFRERLAEKLESLQE